MEKQITAGLRYTFLVHGIMMSIFALTFLFIPVLWGDLTGCLSNQVPQVFRLFGTAILGFAISSLSRKPLPLVVVQSIGSTGKFTDFVFFSKKVQSG